MPPTTQTVVLQPFNQYDGTYSSGGLAESRDPFPSLHAGEGSFLVLVPYNGIVELKSVMDIKPGDSNLIIGYHVYEIACTCSGEHFVALALM